MGNFLEKDSLSRSCKVLEFLLNLVAYFYEPRLDIPIALNLIYTVLVEISIRNKTVTDQPPVYTLFQRKVNALEP